MHSKFFPWEYKSYLSGESSHQGVISCNFPDPFIGKIFLNKIYVNFQGFEKNIVLGNEVTKSFIEDNWLTDSLFSTNELFVVLLASKISSKAQAFIIENIEAISSKNIIFYFEGSSCDLETLLVKKEKASASYHVQAPRFWDGLKVIKFLCDEMKLYLKYDVQEYIVDALELNTQDYVQCLKAIRLNFEDTKSVTVDDVRSLIDSSKLDQFEVAELLSKKQFRAFYEKIMESIGEFNSNRRLISFLQGHLVKLYDPRYSENKKKLSKYDEKILSASKNWSKTDLLNFMEELNRLELNSKKNNPTLESEVNLNYLNFLN